jgi:DNA/RNA-binding domain of Phe-tRNA-synthetase-like protein
MHEIIISAELASKVPGLTLSCIECGVKVREIDHQLWFTVQNKIAELSVSLKIEDISRLPAIAASRSGYRACGKDPARYRLSAEALLRRVVNRGELYQVNNVVDLLNLVSISTGFSIGGYDADRIAGDIIFGIGAENEPYEGIGRGELNIEGMPVFRDDLGAFGTPTSDSVRTSVKPDTGRFLMVIIDYGSPEVLHTATNLALSLLEKYAEATAVQTKIIKI